MSSEPKYLTLDEAIKLVKPSIKWEHYFENNSPDQARDRLVGGVSVFIGNDCMYKFTIELIRLTQEPHDAKLYGLKVKEGEILISNPNFSDPVPGHYSPRIERVFNNCLVARINASADAAREFLF